MPSAWVEKCQAYKAQHGGSYKAAMVACSSGKTKKVAKKQTGSFIFSLSALISGIAAAASTITASSVAIAAAGGAASAVGASAANAIINSLNSTPKPKRKMTKADLKPYWSAIEGIYEKLKTSPTVQAHWDKLAAITEQAIAKKFGVELPQTGAGPRTKVILLKKFGKNLRQQLLKGTDPANKAAFQRAFKAKLKKDTAAVKK